MFLKKGYTKAVDVWSLGIILYVMVSGKFPFEGPSIRDLSKNIQTKEPKFPVHVSERMKMLIRQMLQKDPAQRITIQNILKTPFISDFLKKSPQKQQRQPNLPSSPLLKKMKADDSTIMTKEEKQSLIEELNGIPTSITNSQINLSDTRMLHSSSNPHIKQMSPSSSVSAKLVASGKFKYKPRASLNPGSGYASTPPPKTLKNPRVKITPRNISTNI